MEILRRLSQNQDPAIVRQDHLGNNRPGIALWINDGLELEDAQYVFEWLVQSFTEVYYVSRQSLRVHAATINMGSTERQRVMLNRRRTTLYERIRQWKARSPFRDDEEVGSDDDDDDPDAEIDRVLLPLPSNIDNPNAGPSREIEKELRTGQAHDALKQLRKVLALKLALLRDRREVRGQRDNLRSMAAVHRVQEDIEAIAARYRVAYSALERLGMGNAQRDLRPLNHSDITTANVFDRDRQLGRGFNTQDISWIWRMQDIGPEAQDDSWLTEGGNLSLL